jgi:enterochelin esterase-like enzyme
VFTLATLLGISILQTGFSIKNPTELEQALKMSQKPEVQAEIFRYLDAKNMEKGCWPRVNDKKVGLGIKAPGAKEVELRLVPNGPVRKLKPLGESVFVTVVDLKYDDAYRIQYWADGKRIGDDKTVEIYPVPEAMKGLKDGPKGELRPMPAQMSMVYPNTSSEWWVYKPAAPEPAAGYGLIVFQDGQWAKNYAVPCLDYMIAKGEIPPCVAMFIKPSEYAGGNSIRWIQYDRLNADYTKFILDEYEPVATKALGVKINQDPRFRMMAGGSSGGICAFTGAWERPDKFGLVMSWIGSFVNIYSGESKRDGGHSYPYLIRKTDKKPIRIFLQDGDQDLDNEHGNWYIANLAMEASLKYKSYDYMWVPGRGFHSDAQGRATMPTALKYLFAPVMGKSRRLVINAGSHPACWKPFARLSFPEPHPVRRLTDLS